MKTKITVRDLFVWGSIVLLAVGAGLIVLLLMTATDRSAEIIGYYIGASLIGAAIMGVSFQSRKTPSNRMGLFVFSLVLVIGMTYSSLRVFSPKQGNEDVRHLAEAIKSGSPLQSAPQADFIMPLVAMHNEMKSNLFAMNSSLDALDMNAVTALNVLRSSNLIALETGKRRAAQKLIADHLSTNRAIVARTVERMNNLDLPEAKKKEVMSGVQKSVQNQKSDLFFTLRVAIYSNEIGFLEFLSDQFGDYLLSQDNAVEFRHATNVAIYNACRQRIKSAEQELQSIEEKAAQDLNRALQK